MLRNGLIALVICVLATARTWAGDKVHAVGKEPLKIEVTIGDNDPKVKVTEPNVNVSVDLPAKTYQVKLQAGAKYRLDLMGPDIDPVLAIQDGAGKQIAFDDDGGEGLNSKLDFTAPADGTYKVICASLKGAGKATLTVTPAGGGGKATTGAGAGTFEGKVAATDPTVKLGPREFHAKLHEVKLSGGKKYQLDLVKKDGSIDPLLIVQDKAGKVLGVDDDGAGFPNSRLMFNCPKDDTYKIYAAALDGEGGYSLSVKEVGAGGGGDDAKVHDVGAGLKINGKLSLATRSINYQVKLEAGKSYVIDMKSPNQKALDPYLKLYDATGKLLAEEDDIANDDLDARVNFRAPAAGIYRILATSFGNSGQGDFTLEVREQK